VREGIVVERGIGRKRRTEGKHIQRDLEGEKLGERVKFVTMNNIDVFLFNQEPVKNNGTFCC